MTDASFMAVTAAKFQCVVSAVTWTGPGWQRILVVNPKRWFVRFSTDANVFGPMYVLPGPAINLSAVPTLNNTPFESKWRDSPARTIGEWYLWGTAGTQIVMEEEWYIGD
jgi:hypothetical protein